MSALDLSARFGHLEVVLYLLDHGAKSPNFLLSTCLCKNEEARNEILRLIEHRNYFNIAHVRAAMGDKIFFEGNEKLNISDEFGFTSVFYAVIAGKYNEFSFYKLKNQDLVNKAILNVDKICSDEVRRVKASRLKALAKDFDVFEQHKASLWAYNSAIKALDGLQQKSDSDWRNLAKLTIRAFSAKCGPYITEGDAESWVSYFKQAICFYENISQKSDEDFRRMLKLYIEYNGEGYEASLEWPYFEYSFSGSEGLVELYSAALKLYDSIKEKSERDYWDICNHVIPYLVTISLGLSSELGDLEKAYGLVTKRIDLIRAHEIHPDNYRLPGVEPLHKLAMCALNQAEREDSSATRRMLHQILSLCLENLIQFVDEGEHEGDCQHLWDSLLSKIMLSPPPGSVLEIYEAIVIIFPSEKIGMWSCESDPDRAIYYGFAWDIINSYLNSGEIPFQKERHQALFLLCATLEKALSPESEPFICSEFRNQFLEASEREKILDQMGKLKEKLFSLKSLSADLVMNLTQEKRDENTKLREKLRKLRAENGSEAGPIPLLSAEASDEISGLATIEACINLEQKTNLEHALLSEALSTEAQKNPPQAKREREEEAKEKEGPSAEKKNKSTENPDDSESLRLSKSRENLWSAAKADKTETTGSFPRINNF